MLQSEHFNGAYFGPNTLITHFTILFYFFHKQLCGVNPIMSFILQIRKLGVKSLKVCSMSTQSAFCGVGI